MPENINVLHVLNSASGGSALSTLQLIERLSAHGVKSSLVCFNNASPEMENSIRKLLNNRVLFIPLYWTNKRTRVKWWKRPVLEVLTVWQTWWGHKYQKQIDELINAHKINLIHTSTVVNPEGAIAARTNGLPHIWHVRELIGPDTYYEFPRFQSWISFVDRQANFLVANSEATAERLASYFKESKIKCIVNGIDASGYKVKSHSQANVLVVAMVGNVTSRLKNHEFFIKTASLFKEEEKVVFRIYGALPQKSDAYFSSLKSLVTDNGLDHRVMFMGQVDDAQNIMSDIDILLHPTGNESFGRIFIEAMAGGIPIVAIDKGGSIELVREGINGFRVKENDTKAASGKIKELLVSAELRNTLGHAGRRIVEREYSLELLTDRVTSLYRKVLGPGDGDVEV